MKRLFITLALLAVASLARSQTPTPTSTPTSTPTTTTNSDLEAVLRIYKERVSEGAAPTLILKDGEAKITERQSPATEYSLSSLPSGMEKYATSGGHWTKPPGTAQEIQALQGQIEALKKLNAALEKELANCKPNP